MIDIEEIKSLLSDKVLENANPSLYLFENKKTKKNPISLYQLNIDKKIVGIIRKVSSDYLDKLLAVADKTESNGTQIPEYNPDLGQNIFKLESKIVPLFTQVLFDMVSTKYKLYDRNIIDVNALKSWIFRFEAEYNGKLEQVMFFQRFRPSKMFTPNSFSILDREQYFELITRRVFHFFPEIEVLFFKDTLIVTHRPAFEIIFEYEDYYKSNASEFVAALHEKKIGGLGYSIHFDDLEFTNEKIKQSMRIAHKFHAAQVNEYYKGISFKKLVDLNKRYSFGLNLDDSNNEWKIDVSMDLNIVAMILNDDYERSQLTDNEYVAEGKEKLIPRQ